MGVHKVLKFQRENFQFVHCGHYTGAAALSQRRQGGGAAAAPSIDLVENYTQLVKSKATKEK